MAANIATSSNGTAMVASRNELPWHGQGTVFTEDVSGQEMLKLAHLDWDVLESPVFANTGTMVSKPVGWDVEADKEIMGNVLDNVQPREIPNIKAVYRGDTGNTLGVVGSDFKVFQNSSMIQMFENLVNGHKIQYEVAGGLGKGEAVWILAKIPDLKLDIGGDEMEQYMLIRNGHIGNMTLAVFPTAVRVVCQNTIRIANAGFRERVKKNNKKQDVHTGYAIRHTTNMLNAVKAVEAAYAAMLGDFTITKEMFELMMAKSVTTDMKNSFFDFIIDPTKDESDKAKEISKKGETRRNNRVEILEKLYESPTNQTAASRNTVFGLYNVAVEYIDFHRGTRCTDGVDAGTCKFESAMFGSGASLKDAVFGKALELAS